MENKLKIYLFNEDNNAMAFLNKTVCNFSLVTTCQPHVSQVSVVKTVQYVCLMVCWEGAGLLLKAEKSFGGGGENTVRRGYFHDPISIREAKLFM